MSLLSTRHNPLSLPSPGRQSKSANMSMERALRSIASPKRASAQKKSRKSMDKLNEESVKVAVRIRPLSSTTQTRAFRASPSNNSIIETLDSKPTTTPRRHSHGDGTNEYSYDNVFAEETDTTSIYRELVQDIVASVSKEGINGTVFTYGQTSSGKTFTMQGSGGSTSGIIQMAAHDIFETIRLEKNEARSENTVKVSYVEIYNEELRDLLTDKRKNSALTIREDKRGSITVENLKEVAVRSLEQLMEVFRVGEANKSIGSTKMNDRSSRSHAILKITIEKKTTFNALEKENAEVNGSPSGKAGSFVVKTSSTLNLVDLAGSESVRLTGATGMQKKEGGMINQSLLTLSKVLMSLGQKNPGHVNYRDSKLTRILKPSLSGNARMAVICCISPSDNYIDETRSTLQFATRAKLVKTNAAANEMVECQADVIAKLRMDLEKARLKNESLETQIHELQSEASRSTLTPDEYDGMKRELDNLKTFLFDDGNQKGHKRVSSFSAVHDTSSRQESIVKDDMCVPLADKEDEILRVALAEKTKRVKELQAELTQNGKKSNHSRFSLAAYQDIDNYKSQAEDLGAKLTNANNLITSLGRQIDELSSQKNDALDWIEELFAKSELKDKQVNHANKERDDIIAKYSSLAAEMAKTKQLLEFTIGEKEDATSRMKAMKTEVDALKYCVNANDSVAQGTALLKEQVALLESDVSELKSERDELVVLNDELRSKTSQDSNLIAQLQHTNHMLKSGQGASKHLEELNEELQKEVNQLKRSVQSHQESYYEYKYEKKALLERIDVLEGELSDARATADVKSEELEDVMFSFESEKKAMTKEIVELRGQIQQAQSAQSTSQTKSEADEKRVQFHVDSEQKLVTEQTALLLDQVEEYKNENLSLLARAEQAESELEQIQTTMQAKAFLYESENESLKKEIVDLNEELDSVVSLKEENMKLKSEQFYMKRRIEKTDKEADELRLGRMQLKMAQRAAAESSEALRSTEERMERMEKETYELRTKLEKALQCAAKAEKANNTEQQLRQTQKELSSVKQANITLQRRDKDLRESVSRVRELVDCLASENANLKERNEGYDRKMSEQESRNRELESLVKTLMVERDFAIRKANEVKLTFRELKESNKKMQSQFESLTEARNIALHDKEKTSLKMDQMAADFEADYETLRHKVDDIMREKAELETQIVMLEAGKASIEYNADRILERDNTLSGEYDKLRAELKKATRALAASEDEINHLTRRLDFLKNEAERLTHDNAALKDAIKFSQAKYVPEPCSKKRKTLFDFIPGET